MTKRTPENQAKDAIKAAFEVLEAEGFVFDIEWRAGDPYSTPSLDCNGAVWHPAWQRYWPVPFSIEVKRFDKKGNLPGRQAMTAKRKSKAHIATWLIGSRDSLEEFVLWIRSGCLSPLSTRDTFSFAATVDCERYSLT